ncbi:hypothetical protein RB623_24240 [Mesorhizobium sp. LHD-90]|uniref:hypothetical protein n=1 Tax=Mesorhizobium sp. LHD-90 TaxID=3071414 RepID=UPI0027E1F146|nr:hypothetical protein [Mesorhizobium sp. LHD-90]MDQ6437175.1 hypothetical protein [Mesorhizobium sp. LHD-90]
MSAVRTGLERIASLVDQARDIRTALEQLEPADEAERLLLRGFDSSPCDQWLFQIRSSLKLLLDPPDGDVS